MCAPATSVLRNFASGSDLGRRVFTQRLTGAASADTWAGLSVADIVAPPNHSTISLVPGAQCVAVPHHCVSEADFTAQLFAALSLSNDALMRSAVVAAIAAAAGQQDQFVATRHRTGAVRPCPRAHTLLAAAGTSGMVLWTRLQGDAQPRRRLR